jgi:hypothetical protein
VSRACTNDDGTITEYVFVPGQCIQAFSNGKIPNVVKFNPDEDKQHVFLAGMSDKKIIQVCLCERLHAW